MGCVNCGDDQEFTREGVTPNAERGTPLVWSMDSRLLGAQPVRGHGDPVLGAGLGGGVIPQNIGRGLGRTGGGLTPAVTHAASPDPLASIYPASVRVDFRFDYSTPQGVFSRDTSAGMDRELGGLQGGDSGW